MFIFIEEWIMGEQKTAGGLFIFLVPPALDFYHNSGATLLLVSTNSVTETDQYHPGLLLIFKAKD